MDSSKNILKTIKEYSIPYYRHTYYTKLSALEIRERLLKHMDTKEQPLLSTIFGSRASQKNDYQGKFEGDSFKIHRVTKGKNSNRPVILGTISPSVNTTQVAIVMRLPYISVLPIVIWVIFLFSFVFGDGPVIDFTETTLYFLVFAVCFGYLLTTIRFNYEASKSKKFLKQTLQTIAPNNESDWIIRS